MRLLFLLFALINFYPGAAQNDCYGLAKRAIALEQIPFNEAIWSGVLRTHREDGQIDIHLFDEGKETIITHKKGNEFSSSNNLQYFTLTNFEYGKGTYQINLYDYKNHLICTFETEELGSFEDYDDIIPMDDGITVIQLGDMSETNCLEMKIFKVEESCNVRVIPVYISNKYVSPKFEFSSDFNELILAYSLESKTDRIIYLTYFKCIDLRTNTRKWITSAKVSLMSYLNLSDDDNTIMFTYSTPTKQEGRSNSKRIGIIDKEQRFHTLSEPLPKGGNDESKFILTDQGRFSCTWSNNNVYFYNIDSMRLVWKHTFKDPERVGDLLLFQDQIMVLTYMNDRNLDPIASRQFKDYYVNQINWKGQILHRANFSVSAGAIGSYHFACQKKGQLTISSFYTRFQAVGSVMYKNYKIN